VLLYILCFELSHTDKDSESIFCAVVIGFLFFCFFIFFFFYALFGRLFLSLPSFVFCVFFLLCFHRIVPYHFVVICC